MELCPLVGFEPSTPQNRPLKLKLCSILHTWSKGWTIHARLLLTMQLSCFIDKEWNHLLKQKLRSVLHAWSKGWTIHARLLLTMQLFCFIDKERNHSLKQKLTSVLFIVFDNFFKVTLFYASLLLWNTNAICRISIKNYITYPKHSQIHFLTDTLAYTVFSRDLRIHLCM